MLLFLRKNLPFLLLLAGIVSYSLYFSLFTINRNSRFYSHYFDLGIMHQTVYNTYKGLATGDLSRILELTDPHSSTNQIKRMAIHNDIFLAVLAPFYFIHDGPETLLVIQSVVLALGAYFVFKITEMVFKNSKHRGWFSVIFAYSYLLYPPLQKSNNFDFHAVTLTTTFLLAMYYFYLKKKFIWSGIFALAAILTKEQVGMTVALFGLYILWKRFKSEKFEIRFALVLIVFSVVWVILSLFLIIPHFREGKHFGTEYFSYIVTNPEKIVPMLIRNTSIHYIFILLIPIGLISLLSLEHLAIGLPDLFMNILADNPNMTNIYFHYTAIITPFIFIAAIYGAYNLLHSDFITIRLIRSKLTRHKINPSLLVASGIIISTIAGSLYMSPLPWGHHRDLYPWQKLSAKAEDVALWAKYLENDSMKVSATGHIAGKFVSRRFYYHFANGYDMAEYVIVDKYDISAGFQKDMKEKQYERINSDWRYIRIYNNNGIEAYKNISNF